MGCCEGKDTFTIVLHSVFETSLIANALSQSPGAYSDGLIDAAMAMAPTAAPAWAPLDPDDYAANGFTYGEDEKWRTS